MEILKGGVAGTMESSDIMITLSPNPGEGIGIELSSPVAKQYGRQIREAIESTLRELGVGKVMVTAVDMGAMDCTIRARVRTAAFRAADLKRFDWKNRGGTR